MGFKSGNLQTKAVDSRALRIKLRKTQAFNLGPGAHMLVYSFILTFRLN